MYRLDAPSRAGMLTLLSGVLLLGSATRAQPPQATQPRQPAEVPASAPTEARQPIMARVIEVHGDVRHAPLDSDDYQPCRLGDEYPEQTKIITGVRSSVKLQIGDEEPYTCLLIESVGKTVLSEAYRTADEKKVRVGVAYGRIRAGVAEGGLQSDFTVDSPVATLSKRGTWGLTLFYERDTDYFEVGLSDRGLLEVLNKLTGQRRHVRPRELVTQAMRLWLDQVQFERNTPVADLLGHGDVQVVFNRLEQDGLGVLRPGERRRLLLNLSKPFARGRFAALARRALRPWQLPSLAGAPLHREGFFGTGRGDELIEILIKESNPLAQRGFARPGRYLFRRSALESWLAQQAGER